MDVMDPIKNISLDVTYAVLVNNGYDPNEPTEFDFSDPMSQGSLTCRTVVEVLQVLRELGYLSSDLLQDDTQPAASLPASPGGPGVTSAAHLSVTLGERSTFTELKEFVSHLSELGLDESTHIEGSMSVNIDVNTSNISRIPCGECGYMDYLVEPISHQSSLEYCL
jgi:hypothetical protein